MPPPHSKARAVAVAPPVPPNTLSAMAPPLASPLSEMAVAAESTKCVDNH